MKLIAPLPRRSSVVPLSASLALLATAAAFPGSADAAPQRKSVVRRKPAASRPAPAPPTPRTTPVLDIQKLRVVEAAREPNSIPTCDVLVVGAGLGGVAATEALVAQGLTVILTEPTAMPGGQLTSQAVSCPDENSYIEREPGVGTRTYRALREELRARYAAMPGIKPPRATNVGQCWVSRLSGEPKEWEAVIRTRLDRLRGAGGLRGLLTRHQLVRVNRFPQTGRYHFADFVDLDNGRITRVAAKYLLDATEMGDGVELAGTPNTYGAEARSEHNEPHAPETKRPDWLQSFTYCFVTRWTPEGEKPVAPAPDEYEYFKSLGEYTLGYDYSDARGRVYYKMFGRVQGAGGPFWTYRRLVAASSFTGNSKYTQDLALINWRGNDFHEENPVGKTPEEQVRILKRGKAFAEGFLHWLQTECPRDEGGTGYPEIQLDPDATGSEDGYALHPYIRESRRILAEFTLTENHLAPDPNNPDKKWGEEFPDTVGIALYAMDIHPSKGEPPFLSRALPYHLPLGSFIPRSGAPNVLPAAKNFGATRLALSSARMHPTEWLAGEIAGHLAAYCVRHNLDPTQVRNTPEHLTAFQRELEEAGIPIRWRGIVQ